MPLPVRNRRPNNSSACFECVTRRSSPMPRSLWSRKSRRRIEPQFALKQDLFDRMVLLHAGEPDIEPLELHAEPRVVDPQAMQDGRVHVVDVDRVADDVVTEVV